MLGIEKPLPLPTEDSEKYWEATRRGKLCVSRCGGCGHRFLPPASLCPACWSLDVALAEVSGRARLFSFIVVHRPQHPAFFADAPYHVAIVELEEGPRLHTHLEGVPPEAMRIGMPLLVAFRKIDAETTLPVFRPSEA